MWGARPWEAPAALLADAGIELGVNYPLPLVTLEESRAALAHAASVIDQAMAWPVSAKTPYRPASLPSLRPSAASPTGSSVLRVGSGDRALNPGSGERMHPARAFNAASESDVVHAGGGEASTGKALPVPGFDDNLVRASGRARASGRVAKRAAAKGAARAPPPRGAAFDVDGLASATAGAAASGIAGGVGGGASGSDVSGEDAVTNDSSSEEVGSIGSNMPAPPPARGRRLAARSARVGANPTPNFGHDIAGGGASAMAGGCSGASLLLEARKGDSGEGDHSRRVPAVNGVVLARRAAGRTDPSPNPPFVPPPPPLAEVPCLSEGAASAGARMPEVLPETQPVVTCGAVGRGSTERAPTAAGTLPGTTGGQGLPEEDPKELVELWLEPRARRPDAPAPKRLRAP